MKRSVLSIVTMTLLAGITLGEDRTVAVLEDSEAVKVDVGTFIRVSGSIPAGQGEVTVSVEGPAKLVETNRVRRMVGGRTLIGLTTTEFEVLTQKKGRVKISVTADNKVQKDSSTTVFIVDVE